MGTYGLGKSGQAGDRARGKGEQYDLARISHRHEQLLNWLLLNPDRSLRECADHFGFSQGWVSSIVHSDLFQIALRERQEKVALLVAESIPQKLRRVADIGLDKLTTALEETENPDFILDATDKILHRMGFAPASARNPAGSPGAVQNQQNNFYISAGDLEEARALMHELPGGLPALPDA